MGFLLCEQYFDLSLLFHRNEASPLRCEGLELVFVPPMEILVTFVVLLLNNRLHRMLL